MRKTVIAVTLASVLLLFAMAILPCVRFASAQVFVKIKPDGSVSPSNLAIQQIGDTYFLMRDIGGIGVERSDITLDGNGYTLQGGVGGITLKSIENVTVKNLIIRDTEFGIYLSDCSNITLSNNTIISTSGPFPGQLTGGIWILRGDHNIIVGNRLEGNMYGITLAESNHSILFGNTISGSTNVGIMLFVSSNNTFYHNNFDNTQNVYDDSVDFGESPSINAWDNGEEGNFWSDYNGTDANSDGIGDTPYEVDSNNKDRYPLMKQWDSNKPIDTAPPLISVSSPQNKVYNDSSVPLAFSTNEPASQMSYSLDGQDNVTITGNTTLIGLPNGNHNVTVYATDKAGNVASETISFSVDVPFPTTLVAVASGAAVAIIVVSLLIYFKKRKNR